MKVFVILASLLLVANTQVIEEPKSCYNEIVNLFGNNVDKSSATQIINNTGANAPKCSAKYGGIEKALANLQIYVNNHITRSYEYLLMSTHFANYQMNRAGFEQLFRKLSDSTWEDAIGLIKHLSKRGGKMNFNQENGIKIEEKTGSYELRELQSMAKAVDMHKQLATAAFEIHEGVSRKHTHDPELASYIEEEFAHKHAKTVRELSGHVADLIKFQGQKDSSLALFLFDEYLQKA